MPNVFVVVPAKESEGFTLRLPQSLVEQKYAQIYRLQKHVGMQIVYFDDTPNDRPKLKTRGGEIGSHLTRVYIKVLLLYLKRENCSARILSSLSEYIGLNKLRCDAVMMGSNNSFSYYHGLGHLKSP